MLEYKEHILIGKENGITIHQVIWPAIGFCGHQVKKVIMPLL